MHQKCLLSATTPWIKDLCLTDQFAHNQRSSLSAAASPVRPTSSSTAWTWPSTPVQHLDRAVLRCPLSRRVRRLHALPVADAVLGGLYLGLTSSGGEAQPLLLGQLLPTACSVAAVLLAGTLLANKASTARDDETDTNQAPPAAAPPSGSDNARRPTPEQIWAAAWEPLEQAQQLQALAASAAAAGSADTALSLNPKGGAAPRRPRLMLQGIAAGPRAQLLALALLALERQVAALPQRAAHASAEEWRLLIAAMLASCSVTAAAAWLGYTPAELQLQAAALVERLRAEATPGEGDIELAASAASQPSTSRQSGAKAALDSLWLGAASKDMLHATIARYLRFGGGDETSGSDAAAESMPASVVSDAGSGLETSDGAASISGRLQALALLTASQTGIRGWQQQEQQGQQQQQAGERSDIWQHAPLVLHDMAILVAESVAAVYLAEARQGRQSGTTGAAGEQLEAGPWPVFLHQRLHTTRMLERFRNQVVMERWAHANYGDVAAIYEDRHELWGIGASASLLQRSIPAKRTKELEGLKGWRNAVSLLLELGDAVAPLLRLAAARLGEAVSWLLVTLIGRSLGLVYRGVLQSLGQSRPARKPRPGPRRTSPHPS